MAFNSQDFRLRFQAMAATCAMWSTFGALAFAQFETRASFPTQNVSYSVVVGDFNRDGILDMASVDIVHNTTGSVEILLGNGDGTFRAGAAYALAAPAFYAAAASLQDNGVLDLVVGAAGAKDVYVLLGNGDGTFQNAVSYATIAEAVMVGIGDFTGGGKTDIVALEEVPCYCVEVLPSNGDGTFGSPVTTPLPYSMSGYAITTGDFNSDGKLDVAVSGEAFPNFQVAILLGNGDGTFTADGFYVVPEDPQSIATGYFTGSRKKIDLAVASSLGGHVSVLLGNGDGTFQQPVLYATTLPTWVIAQDLDGDGKIDLAASNASQAFASNSGVTVFKGNGDGTFQPGKFYLAGKQGNYVAAGDFNGDHRPDLVVVDYNVGDVATLLNTGVVSFAPTTPLNFGNQSVGTTSRAHAVTLTNTGTTELKVQSMKASAEFAMKSTCGQRVAPGAKCTISATFSPTQKGAQQGTISVIDNASSKPQVIELLGTGT